MSRLQILLILLALAIIQGLLYAFLIPPWQSPDEPAHFESTQLLVQKGYWFNWEEYKQTPLSAELFASLEAHHFWAYQKREPPSTDLLKTPVDVARQTLVYGGPITASNYPPLYYLLLSVFYRAVASQDIVIRLYVLRLVSVAITAITITVVFIWAEELFPDDKVLSVSIPAFALLLPMHAAINSTVTSDVLAELLATSVLFVTVLSLKRGFSWWRWGLLMILLTLGMLTKRTTFFLIPTLTVLILMQIGQQRLSTRVRVALFIAAALAALLAISSLTMLGTRYGNWWTFLGVFNFVGLSPQNFLSLFDARHSNLAALLTYRDAAWIAFMTFWGDFGWVAVPVHAPIMRGLEALSGLIGLGVILFIARRLIDKEHGDLQPWQRQSLAIMLCAILFAVGSAFAPALISIELKSAPHARYFFPTILPIATFFLLGLRELFPYSFPYRRWVPLFFIGFLGLYNIYCILFITNYFYRPQI